MKVGKAASEWNVMKRGCPQGSSFGPTLWNLYQNDLSYHVNEIANSNMYADDHQMYIVVSDMPIMCTDMEKEGNSALKWYKDNYCHLIWHFCKASDTRKVERIQERELRIVYNSHSETYMNLLDRAKLPSLLNRRLQDIVILMYKVKYRLVPDFTCDIFSTKSCK